MARVALVVLTLVALGMLGRNEPRATAQEALSISGTVSFHDDGDGVRQPTSQGMARVRVLLSGPNGSQETRTDQDGSYYFGGLEAGSYVVSVPDEPFHLILVSPARMGRAPYSRNVDLADSSATGIDFGFAVAEGLTGFRGLAFINAAPVSHPKVRALIGGVDCTGPAQLLPTDQDPASFWISVLSSELLEGCGDDGDVVAFTINGFPANETAIYSTRPPRPPGPLVSPPDVEPLQDARNWLTLTVGARFALFWPIVEDGVSTDDFTFRHGHTVVALIDGKVCGVGQPRVWQSNMLIVPEESMESGCGREGAQVSFAVNGFAVDKQVLWQPGPSSELRLEVNETAGAPMAGPRFAYYNLTLPALPPDYVGHPSMNIEAQINGKACGYGGREEPGEILIAVIPAELDPSCGRTGDVVTFLLNGKLVATGEWRPGFQASPTIAIANQSDSPVPQEAPPRAIGAQISPPSVGDAGLR